MKQFNRIWKWLSATKNRKTVVALTSLIALVLTYLYQTQGMRSRIVQTGGSQNVAIQGNTAPVNLHVDNSTQTESHKPPSLETELLCKFDLPCESVQVFFGSNQLNSEKPLFIAPTGDPLFGATLDNQGRLLFNGTLFNSIGETVCEIRDNQFHLLNCNYKLWRPELNHVVVKGRDVELDCLCGKHCSVSIRGHFYDGSGRHFAANAQGLVDTNRRIAIVGSRFEFKSEAPSGESAKPSDSRRP